MHCKHRLSLFDGDITRVREKHAADLALQIATMLRGSDVERALHAVIEAEAAAATAVLNLKRAKKALDRVMHI
jgi:hypothetical protein